MDLSVVIRCGDDWRVFDCIKSIDESVEIIVALSENPDLQKELESLGIRYCVTPRRNLSVTSNMGIAKASFEKVVITDSDTVFEPGCIRNLYHALDEFSIVRARLRFTSDQSGITSRIVAEARDYVNSLRLVYTPGVAIRKDVVAELGGFVFNDIVPYAVDADLNFRIKASKTRVKFADQAVLNHCAESYRHDLKAAYRIGIGCAISYLSLRKMPQFSAIKWNDLKGVRLGRLPDIMIRKGVLVLAYQILWDYCYWLGYFSRRVRNA